MTSTPSLLKTAALLALLAALGGCTTLSNRPLCPATTDTSFWFRLDPKLLATQTELHRYPYSYNARFDPLFAKCELLLAALNQKTALKLYEPQSIQYEIKATLAMLASLDPIESFIGVNIQRAPAAYAQVQLYKNALSEWAEGETTGGDF